MRKLFIIGFFLFCGCSKIEEATKRLDEQENVPQEIVYDGCQYLKWTYFRQISQVVIVHKGNCTNHVGHNRVRFLENN